MKKVKGTKMKDGKLAWKTTSGRYYARRNPTYHEWSEIAYYNLKTHERIPLAKAICAKCNKIIESKYCGHYVSCKCGKSSVDTDRWMPERHRFGGLASFTLEEVMDKKEI